MDTLYSLFEVIRTFPAHEGRYATPGSPAWSRHGAHAAIYFARGLSRQTDDGVTDPSLAVRDPVISTGLSTVRERAGCQARTLRTRVTDSREYLLSPSSRRKPSLFMTVRREIAELRSETGAWSREGGRCTPCGTWTD